MSEPDVAAVLAGSVAFLLSKLGFLTAKGFADGLAPLDLVPQHFALLRFIEVAKGRSQHALAEALGIPPSRIVALVDDLEERGLVERRRDRTDRRVNALHLTAKGRKQYAKAQEVAGAWEDRLLGALSDEERATLLGYLQRLAATHDLPIGVHPGFGQP
jgi:DNA-binding MarR family transcriptional regulator